jgi:hypothetical protein
MTRYMTFGGIAVGALIAGLVTFAFRPSQVVPLVPTQSAHAVVPQKEPAVQRTETGSVADSVLREAARRRLAKALIAQEPARPAEPTGGEPTGTLPPLKQAALTPESSPSARPLEAENPSIQTTNPSAQTTNPSAQTTNPSTQITNVPITAPAAAPAPPRPSEDANRLAALASQSIDNGDIVGARLLLERAARGGEGKALFMLAETYDPFALTRMNVRGLTGDPDIARNYYVRALSAGVGEARDRLAALAQ